MQQLHTSQHDENVKHPLHCYTNALFLLRCASLHNAFGGWQTTMFRSHLVWWACHNRSTEDAVVGEVHNCCATWNIYIYLFVCFWAMVDVIVSLCDNWPPPPCSRLHSSLQCCSLLNYYQWVWRDTCCLSFLSLSPSWQPLSNTNTRTYAAARPVFHLTWVCWMLMRQKGRDLYCASVSGANRCFHVHIHAWRELRSNTGRDLHTLMHECTPVLTQTQMLLCSLYKWGCLQFLLLIFLFSHKSCTPNKVIILGLAAPNIINEREREEPRRCSVMM